MRLASESCCTPGIDPAFRWWIRICLLVPYVYLLAFALLHAGGITVMQDGTGIFYALYRPVWEGLAGPDLAAAALHWVLPLALLLMLVTVVQAVDRAGRATPAADWLGVALLALFLFAFACVTAMMRGGLHGITQAYLRTETEFTGDLPRFSSVYDIFHNYLARHRSLTLHARAYPPGVLAILHLAGALFGRGALPLSLFTIGAGAIAVFPLYLLVRDTAGRTTALIACSLYAVMPSVVLFTATSTNALFMPVIFMTLAAFQRALTTSPVEDAAREDAQPLPAGDGRLQRSDLAWSRRSSAGTAPGAGEIRKIAGGTASAFLAGGLFAILSLLSFNHLTLGVWFVLAALWPRRRAGALTAGMKVAALMGVGFLAVHAAVRVGSGFDMLACFKAAKVYFDGCQAGLTQGPRMASPWAWRLLINPAVVLFFAGTPVSVLFVLEVARGRALRSEVIRCALTFATLCLLYLARGEAERAAMYMLPFLLLPAAVALRRLHAHEGPRPVVAALIMLGVQSWMTEAVLYTYW